MTQQRGRLDRARQAETAAYSKLGLDPAYFKGSMMSDVFEGVVVFTDEAAISRSFAELRSHLALRLTRLAPSILGVYRSDYPNGRPFDIPEQERIAQRLSEEFDRALLVFYDDRCDACGAALYSGGRLTREFGEPDEVWVELDDDGTPNLEGPRYSGDALPDDFDDGDCIRTAIDAGLDAAGFGTLNQALLKQAFCYDEFDRLAESAPYAD